MTAIEIDEAIRDFMRVEELNWIHGGMDPEHYSVTGQLVINNSADTLTYKAARAALLSCFELVIERLEDIGADWIEVPELRFGGDIHGRLGTNKMMLLRAEAVFVFVQGRKKK